MPCRTEPAWPISVLNWAESEVLMTPRESSGNQHGYTSKLKFEHSISDDHTKHGYISSIDHTVRGRSESNDSRKCPLVSERLKVKSDRLGCKLKIKSTVVTFRASNKAHMSTSLIIDPVSSTRAEEIARRFHPSVFKHYESCAPTLMDCFALPDMDLDAAMPMFDTGVSDLCSLGNTFAAQCSIASCR